MNIFENTNRIFTPGLVMFKILKEFLMITKLWKLFNFFYRNWVFSTNSNFLCLQTNVLELRYLTLCNLLDKISCIHDLCWFVNLNIPKLFYENRFGNKINLIVLESSCKIYLNICLFSHFWHFLRKSKVPETSLIKFICKYFY